MAVLLKRFIGVMERVQTSPGVERMPHNGENPGFAVLALKAGKRLQSAQVGLLDQILRVLLIARQPARQVVRGVQMG